MALIQDVKDIMVRLIEADDGWLQLFQLHGYSFTLAQIEGASDSEFADQLLNHPLTPNRTVHGFQEFCN